MESDERKYQTFEILLVYHNEVLFEIFVFVIYYDDLFNNIIINFPGQGNRMFEGLLDLYIG